MQNWAGVINSVVGAEFGDCNPSRKSEEARHVTVILEPRNGNGPPRQGVGPSVFNRAVTAGLTL